MPIHNNTTVDLDTFAKRQPSIEFLMTSPDINIVVSSKIKHPRKYTCLEALTLSPCGIKSLIINPNLHESKNHEVLKTAYSILQNSDLYLYKTIKWLAANSQQGTGIIGLGANDNLTVLNACFQFIILGRVFNYSVRAKAEEYQ